MHSTPAPEPPMPGPEPVPPSPEEPHTYWEVLEPPAPDFREPPPPPPDGHDDGMYSPHLPVDHDRKFDGQELPDPPPSKAEQVAGRKPVNVAIAVAAVIAVLAVAAWLWLT